MAGEDRDVHGDPWVTASLVRSIGSGERGAGLVAVGGQGEGEAGRSLIRSEERGADLVSMGKPGGWQHGGCGKGGSRQHASS